MISALLAGDAVEGALMRAGVEPQLGTPLVPLVNAEMPIYAGVVTRALWTIAGCLLLAWKYGGHH